MSFSFSVAQGPAADFAERAAQAKADLVKSYEANDYALTQVASETCDAAVKAASELAAQLAGGADGTVSASISGHHATDPTQASSASISVGFTPTAPAATS